ncbi:MAG: NAD(P)/FAD-dependent oxidoreductase [Lysobacteraceae bacterium]
MELQKHDAIIMGGGLAGLTLAIQLRRRFPDIDILVLERRPHPAPAAAFKIGESTVEIGAHYFADTLGLRDHLDTEQIRKFGFRFFFSEGRRELHNVTELGVREVLPTPTWQIDRGIFENFLGERARELGVRFLDGAIVRGFEIADRTGDALHNVRYEHQGNTFDAQARWLLDASGRIGLIKRKLDLSEANAHDANAVWFRIDARLPIDACSDNSEWASQCNPPERWRSTNHLNGPGYWAWLIPLSSGAHSVGIVCDAAMHPLATMNTFEKSMDWLRAHQPLIADMVDDAMTTQGREALLDFAFFRNFSYSCKQVFSADRWALTGEAGLFLDPFYSPGSDFIAIANTYICDLIAHDRRGDSLAPYARIYQDLYFSFYRNTLTLYQDQYPLFGNAEVMPIKVLWDYTYYWGVLCQLVFQQRLTDIALLGEMRGVLEDANELNRRMQAFFLQWHAHNADTHDNPAVMLDQGRLPWFYEINRTLHDTLDDAQLRLRLRENVVQLRALGEAILQRASESGVLVDSATLASFAPRDSDQLAEEKRPTLFARAA